MAGHQPACQKTRLLHQKVGQGVRRDSLRPGQAHSKQPLSAERLDGLGKGLHLICAMMGSSIEAFEVGCLGRTALCDTDTEADQGDQLKKAGPCGPRHS